MKKSHSPEQLVRKLRQAEAELAAGASIPEIARRLGISEATFHRCRNQYGGMKADVMKRFKELEKVNVRLKKIVADRAADIDIRKEVSRGNIQARPGGEPPSSTFVGILESPSVGRAG
jgi:putative transposase